MKFNRFLTPIVPLLVFILEETYFLSPKLIFVAVAMANLLIFFAVWQFSQASEIDKRWWNYLTLPAAMTSAVIIYSIFLSNKIAIQLLFASNIVFLYIYLRYAYYYLLNPSAYKVFSLENFSSYINWLAFFLLASSIYGLQSFLNLPIFWLVPVMISLTALLVYQIIWAYKLELKSALASILISCLILVELFWSISFLPFNHNISGLLLAVNYYVITGLVKNYLLLKLDAAKVKIYLILGAASLSLILITAKWM